MIRLHICIFLLNILNLILILSILHYLGKKIRKCRDLYLPKVLIGIQVYSIKLQIRILKIW